ncbi:MAG TPA: DUF4331 family protein [Chthoniobacteraceae bacterium]
MPILLGIITCLNLSSIPLRAADHGDAPALDQDQGADIADLFMFIDPNDSTQLVLVGTVHGFIVPGEAGSFAAFDSNVKFRFEIYNNHVNVVDNSSPPRSPNYPIVANALGNFLQGTKNKPTAAQTSAAKHFVDTIKPNLTIDVNFSPREVVQDSTNPDPKINLAKPGPQDATITFGGFKQFSKLKNHGVFKTLDGSKPGDPIINPIVTTVSTQAATANDQTVNTILTQDANGDVIKFFAGEAADPFFFDLTAFSNFIASCHSPTGADPTVFNRGRNSFAGYNVLAIAIELPISLVTGTNGSVVGADFLTQRHSLQDVTSNGTVGMGGFKTVDRLGNPAVNVALIPFNDKDKYNGGTPHGDALLGFAGDMLTTIQDLGLGTLSNASAVDTLVYLVFDYGDILKLNPSAGNAGYPNGRRLDDDTITTILSVLAGGTVNQGATQTVPPENAFPFVALPYQPQPHGTTVGGDDTQN